MATPTCHIGTITVGTIEIVELVLQTQTTLPWAVLCSKLPSKFHFIASNKILWW